MRFVVEKRYSYDTSHDAFKESLKKAAQIAESDKFEEAFTKHARSQMR